jgi:hypothetical protein
MQDNRIIRPQGYRIVFGRPRTPSFPFSDPPYTYKWVLDFASGLASACQKDFEVAEDDLSDARNRGERMGQHLKLFARRWDLKESDFRSICIEWHSASGVVKKLRYNEALDGRDDRAG